jgi:TPR repeat protein
MSGNYAKAAWLYQKAVDRGHEKAKYFLAQMYLTGRGVTEDRNRAMTLLRESANAGYEKAKKLLCEIEDGKRG